MTGEGTASARRLIINADDFGQSDGINAGVVRAHEYGVVTSASLMGRWPASASAAAYAVAHAELSLGLHFDLGEWRYVRGRWEPIYVVCDTDESTAVAREVEAQLSRFRDLVGRDPTHLDSHQHVHREGPAREHLSAAARALGVPLREVTPGIRYEGGFYGMSGKGLPLPEQITVAALERLLSSLPTGVTELGCHPGLGGDVDSPYRVQRDDEVAVLCDPRVRRIIAEQRLELSTFCDIPVVSDGDTVR